MDEISRFISKFHDSGDNNSLRNECSYWFAMILYRRFIRDGAKIMFCKKENHFGTMIHGKVYDFTGDTTSKYEWVSWMDSKILTKSIKDQIIEEYIMF